MQMPKEVRVLGPRRSSVEEARKDGCNSVGFSRRKRVTGFVGLDVLRRKWYYDPVSKYDIAWYWIYLYLNLNLCLYPCPSKNASVSFFILNNYFHLNSHIHTAYLFLYLYVYKHMRYNLCFCLRLTSEKSFPGLSSGGTPQGHISRSDLC